MGLLIFRESSRIYLIGTVQTYHWSMFRYPDTFNKLRYVTSEVADNKLNNIDKQQKFY
jgi:hypothetical protein